MALESDSLLDWLEVDLGAVVHNFRVARRAAGEGVGVFPVVKADAYGLGAVKIALALEAEGAEGFCVALVEEARELRQAGIRRPIALLSAVEPGLESEVGALGLEPVIHRLEDARRLHDALPEGRSAQVHLKVDVGMGRLGFYPEEIPEALDGLERLPRLRLVSLVGHLACADEPQRPENGEQIRRMEALMAHWAVDRRLLSASLANSAGVMAHPGARFDWVRPGIMLYGASPFYPARRGEADGLRPVARWRGRILQVREMAAGTPVGYGHGFTTQRPTRLAIVRAGYADGYNRLLSGRGSALLHGTRVPVAGRVCMDLLALDITDAPPAQAGEAVTLLGRDGPAEIPVEEMASWLDTIPYEIFCRLGHRVRRLHLPPT
ncbi:MAG: alanine racemase [Magnetococcales bacterium]|nr:alanine racemase [Magnetococcales bacterium]